MTEHQHPEKPSGKAQKVTELVRLRQRFLDLQKLGALSPETFGMFQQSFMEVYQEAERRRQSCLHQVTTLEKQIAQARAEASAFSVMSSILYSIVDGHIGIETRRIREAESRAAQEAGEAPVQSASGATYDDDDAPPPAKEGFDEPPVEAPPASTKAKATGKGKGKAAKNKVGRPKGSKNKPKK